MTYGTATGYPFDMYDGEAEDDYVDRMVSLSAARAQEAYAGGHWPGAFAGIGSPVVSSGAAASQAMFEAMFDHAPKVDLTRPARKSPTAAERRAWRRSA